MRLLVTGGTGHVGRLVVERLSRAGADVRVVSRRPGPPAGRAEMVAGDLAEPESLRAALRGAERLYLFPHPPTAAAVVRLAAEAGVRRIVTLSSGAVTTGYDTNYHVVVERAVEASGVAWAHVRPGEFMLNSLWLWGPSIRAGRVVREPFPDLAGRPVHERDIADVAAAALLEDDPPPGVVHDVNGPERISRRAQVRAIAAALGEEVRLETVTPGRARELYLAQGGFAAANAEFLTGFESYSGEPGGDAPPPEEPEEHTDAHPVEPVAAGPGRTYAEWAEDHADDFR